MLGFRISIFGWGEGNYYYVMKDPRCSCQVRRALLRTHMCVHVQCTCIACMHLMHLRSCERQWPVLGMQNVAAIAMIEYNAL